MARIRSVKPEFWTDGNMVRLSVTARLFYIGTWNFALCDRGHLPDDPLGLKLKILPADDVNPGALVDELITLGRLVRRRSAGRTYLMIPRLPDHGRSEHRWQSRCPHCISEEAEGFTEDSPNLAEPRATSPEPSEPPPTPTEDRKGLDWIGEDRTGEDVPPSAGALVRRDTTEAIIANWLESCRKRPPGNVIGQVGKHVKTMLGEGLDPADVRAGLDHWQRKGMNPSALPGVVNEIMNSGPASARASPNGSTTDRKLAQNVANVEAYLADLGQR